MYSGISLKQTKYKQKQTKYGGEAICPLYAIHHVRFTENPLCHKIYCHQKSIFTQKIMIFSSKGIINTLSKKKVFIYLT